MFRVERYFSQGGNSDHQSGNISRWKPPNHPHTHKHTTRVRHFESNISSIRVHPSPFPKQIKKESVIAAVSVRFVDIRASYLHITATAAAASKYIKMKGRLELWIAIFVLVFSFQGQAVLDEVISLGGGLDEPKILLTNGDTTPVQVRDGDTLQSRCYLENENDIENYQFTWVSRSDRTDEVLSENQDLYLSGVTSDTFRYPIYCLVERLDDGEVFEKQIAVNYHGRAQPRTLEIRPMPSEDMATGMVVRRCQVVPTPPPHEQWEYTWSEPSGRIITSDSILSIRVTGEQPSVTYTCEARNPRTNDVLIGEFTVHARNIPTSSQLFLTVTVRSLNKMGEVRFSVSNIPIYHGTVIREAGKWIRGS
ncbi:unnamed protein product [Mesocestoides corti]|uniref:Ig-like domain-containing protein n=2 Tax=Mesocestoides corti TaxID=53468 RepID=A0A0R3UA56_MESCO|nr:unnamed protein product [Mesocestoides corti]